MPRDVAQVKLNGAIALTKPVGKTVLLHHTGTIDYCLEPNNLYLKDRRLEARRASSSNYVIWFLCFAPDCRVSFSF